MFHRRFATLVSKQYEVEVGPVDCDATLPRSGRIPCIFKASEKKVPRRDLPLGLAGLPFDSNHKTEPE